MAQAIDEYRKQNKKDSRYYVAEILISSSEGNTYMINTSSNRANISLAKLANQSWNEFNRGIYRDACDEHGDGNYSSHCHECKKKKDEEIESMINDFIVVDTHDPLYIRNRV